MPFCFLTNCPKAGTHLMRQVLGMKEGTGSIVAVHVATLDVPVFQKCMLFPTGISGEIGPPQDETLRFIQLFPSFTIIRDPRDIIVSWFHWIDVRERRRRLAIVQQDRTLSYKDYEGDERKNLMIENLHEEMDRFTPWLDTDIVVVRFEDIIENPAEALVPVAERTGIPLDVLVERSRFRGGKTFRKGVAGEWKHEFSKKQLKRFNELYARIMDAWGYECTS